MELLVQIYCYGRAENGCGLESEKVQEMRGVSEGGTNGTWLQLVRSCAVPIDCGVPDLWGGSDRCAGCVGVSDVELHYEMRMKSIWS